MTGGAARIARDVRDGRARAVDVVGDALDRIARANPTINAFCEVRGADALARAAAIDAAVAAGRDPGPLAGVPVGVKDAIWEAGVEATNGSRALLGFRPERSAVVVEWLEAAGAVVVGRTNLPEFCYRGDCTNDLYGATGNPWDPGRTAGGSSGGSAAAVAAGLCAIALGTDGGGSVRIPSSFCGVVGLKQSYGLVPREPGWPGWVGLNHVGPITATVEDAALALSVMAGPDACDATSLPALGLDYRAAAGAGASLAGLRIAASEDLGYVRPDGAVRARFRDAVRRLEDLGAEVVWDHPDVGNPLETWNTLAFADNVPSEGALLATGRVGADAAQLIRLGEGITAAGYARARNEQHRFAAAWHGFMGGYDLVVTPAMECTAFALGRTAPEATGGVAVEGVDDDWCHYCYAFNLTGQPAISVPMGLVDGLPVGLQIVGRRWADDVVLRAAAAWEAAAPWQLRAVAAATAPAEDVRALVAAAACEGRSTVELRAAGGLVAGARVPTGTGAVRVRRVHSPEDGRVVAELEAMA